ncbi:hypothetical protein [uncultured Slackia sp.]|uniref:hypothetical protein n=1 Tax=uncultured Slackia sp. TaxID=665903 RepID=UPI0026DEA6A6|nr:hypothetical protein [uncultured Slackia sp.]
MSETIKAQREQLAHVALGNKDILEGLIERMDSSSRRTRQNTASTLSFVAAAQPEAMLPYLDVVINALERPEAQTRWESLDILTALVPFDADRCESALPGAEGALFDEDSGPLHLAAVRFLCRIGSTSQERSIKVWPLIDEAIQCYHGDVEFHEMLAAIALFSESDLDSEVADALKARMEFDARNAKGSLKKRAQQILDKLNAE